MKTALREHAGMFRYKGKRIPFHFWSHTDNQNTGIDTIIFLGSSQFGRIVKWVAGNAPAGTVVIEGLPHHEADQTARDLKEFARDYTAAAFSAALQTFSVTSAHIIAESQAAPGAILFALSHLKQVKNVALIAPLGLTAHLLGSTPKRRLRELKKRGFLSSTQFVQSPFYDWHNLYLNLVMFRVLLFDARWNASGQKYAAGASYDLREDFRKLALNLRQKDNNLILILGERDRIFPVKEVIDTISTPSDKGDRMDHIKVITLKTSHASLAVREGKRILGRAVKAVRQN